MAVTLKEKNGEHTMGEMGKFGRPAPDKSETVRVHLKVEVAHESKGRLSNDLRKAGRVSLCEGSDDF